MTNKNDPRAKEKIFRTQKFIGGVVRKFEFVGPNTRCYDRTFLVGSASLDPTLVI